MKIKKSFTKSLTVLLTVVIFLLAGYRYFYLNKNVPREYSVEKYFIGQTVKLDNFEVVVNSFGKSDENLNYYKTTDLEPYSVTLTIKNTSKESVSPGAILSSQLSLGTDYVDYAEPAGDVDKLRGMMPGQVAHLNLSYLVRRSMLNSSANEFEFYLSKSLYKNQISDKLKELKFLGKVVELQ